MPYRPGAQPPLHIALLNALAVPHTPAAHGVQVDAPAVLYVPGLHGTAVAFVDPAGHAYPAAHASLQLDDVRPVALPKRPAGHCPLQSLPVKPGVDPNRPAAHAVHTLAPPTLNLPAGHTLAVADVDPDGQVYPGVHGPLQFAVVSPAVAPYRPGLHCPLHDAVVSPGVAP